MHIKLPFPLRPPKPPMPLAVLSAARGSQEPSRSACPPWSRPAKARTAILLWLIGIPIPIIILIFLVKGCVT